MVSSSKEPGKIKPKVVRMISRLNGGPARQACTLHERLAPYLETRLVVGSPANGEQDMSYLLSSQDNLFRVPRMSREISLWRDLLAFIAILRFLRRERPDIVHTHTAKAGAIGRLAAWLAGVPVIVHTYHGHIFAEYFGIVKTQAYLMIERLLGRLSTHIIAISESQQDELCSLYRIAPLERISVIRNGFELEQISKVEREKARHALALQHDEFVVVWAGRMVPVKDVELLAQVIRSAWSKKSRISFLVVGDGTERTRLETLIQGCGNARLLGWQQEMGRIWAAADLALLTSRTEGTPTTLIEAMAGGTPFVATQVGGVKDLALGPLRPLPDAMGYQAANGFLAARTVEALFYCVEQLAGDPLLAREMAATGRAFALEKFPTLRLVADMRLLYRTLLAGTSVREFGVVQRSSEENASEAEPSL
jgi:glycosyltransferase involved in cell wall biosynthesis